ncbi:ninja-family protein AFP3-like [Olea europaea var. sylvestris]|uniref:Ninja-family protein n=1 Tax=Olea europaea subsp. europaea TaxID=158383 RepID=A0A8S0SDM5_OLEEU|nr:ninja-family protein AFP3-like [Olea europaea var. sylvestris]CAA2989806.1 ninja-family AFP3-like [Olea europaea subsp. europaea]
MMNENREKFGLSMKKNGFSMDILHKYMNGKRFSFSTEEDNDGNEEIELSLGLSTNGRFGVDPKRAAKKVKRSSSISNLVFTVGAGGDDGGRQAVGVSVDVYTPLTRTCSLPVEAEEELRKRRELQSIRRMEAKRKRLEKLNNGRVVKDKVDLGANSSEDNNNNKNNNNCEINGIVKGRINVNSNGNEIPLSQSSIGSQGSGSSGISDIQSQRSEGVKQGTEAKSPPSVQSLPAQIEHKPVRATEKEANEIHKNVMLDMPCVSTKGDGPNGKKIEGFLYRYKKGEEVKIVCVCHGKFLSPAEFVKHAGGDDVANPLRHIVVNHSRFL